MFKKLNLTKKLLQFLLSEWNVSIDYFRKNNNKKILIYRSDNRVIRDFWDIL